MVVVECSPSEYIEGLSDGLEAEENEMFNKWNGSLHNVVLFLTI